MIESAVFSVIWRTSSNQFTMANVSKLVTTIAILLLATGLASSDKFPNTTNNSYQYSSYQKGIFCNATHLPVTPATLFEIQHIVQEAVVRNITLKPLGHLHSITDIICTDGLPINMEKINHFKYYPETGLARIGAGASLANLTKHLDLVGRALEGMPAYGGITVGGAMATGAHGSSLTRETTLSSQIVGLTMVDGRGNIVHINEKIHRMSMNAFRVNLGLLGIIYEVTIRTIPQYKVHTQNVAVVDKMVLNNVEQLVKTAKTTDFFHFFWFPSAGQVVLSKTNVFPINSVGNCETHFIADVSATKASLFKNFIELMNKYKMDFGLYLLQWFSLTSFVTWVFGKTPLFTHENMKHGKFCSPSIGYSHKMLANSCNDCVWDQGADSVTLDESEVVIPVTELGPAIETMRSILDGHPVEFYLTGILFRFMKPSTGLLAINRNAESVGIEWVFAGRTERFRIPKTGLGATQALVQALIEKHQGKTHWGKNGLHFSSPEMIQFQHGNYREQFVKQMERWDPNGVFLNEFGRRIRYQEASARISEHCALLDSCICKKDTDCGEQGASCSEIMGYKACVADQSNAFVEWLRLLNRRAILGLQYFF